MVGGRHVKLRTLAVTCMAVGTCALARAHDVDARCSASGVADVDPAAWTRHAATWAQADGTRLDLGADPAPFGLMDLSAGWIRWRQDDAASAWTAAAEGMAGPRWTELRCTGGRQWRVDTGVTAGVLLHAMGAAGADVPFQATAAMSVGLRWTLPGWTLGASLHDLPLAGASGTSASIGAGTQASAQVDVAADLIVMPPYGIGLMVAALGRVHPLLSVRCAIRTWPMHVSMSARCLVHDVAVRCTIDVVRDLGLRSSVGVTWSW